MLATTLGPGLALAQTSGKPLTIGLEASGVYETNPVQASTQVQSLRGLQGSEWILSPAATVTYTRDTGRQAIALRGRAGYDFHQKNKVLNRERIDTTLDYGRKFGSLCSVNGVASYLRAQSELQDLTLAATDNAAQTVKFEFSETCGTPSGLTENIKVNHLSEQNSNGTLVDFKTTGISGGLGYTNRAIGNVAVIATRVVTKYSGTSTSLALRRDDLTMDGIGLQIQRPIGSRLAGTAAVFYSRASGGTLVTTPPTPEDKFSGVTATAGLTYRVGPRLRLAGEVARNVGGTSRPDEGYVVSTTARLTADYTMSSRISTGMGAEWTKDDYRGGSPLLPSLGPDRLRVMSEFAHVTMRFGRNSSLSAGVRHQQGRADVPLFDYSSTRINLTASTLF